MQPPVEELQRCENQARVVHVKEENAADSGRDLARDQGGSPNFFGGPVLVEHDLSGGLPTNIRLCFLFVSSYKL